MSPDLAAALDRTQVSSRKATYVLSTVATSVGVDPETLNISKSSIHRRRARLRSDRAKTIKETFSVKGPLVVHWDGKMMEDLTGKETVDRLPVLVSGEGVEKLLAVPKIDSGSGQTQAQAVEDCLDDWDIKCRVQALSFDTTASNAGIRQGACELLSQALDRNLLFLACRHHIHELVLGSAYQQALKHPSTGPEIQLFRRFREQWSLVDQSDFKDSQSDPPMTEAVTPIRSSLLHFFRSCGSLLREDYQELAELCIIFLGGSPGRGVPFRAPGASHRARWMAKVLYAIKMYLFRHQIRMIPAEDQGITDLVLFAVTVYAQPSLSRHPSTT